MMKYLYKITLLLSFVPLICFAKQIDKRYEKSKTVEKKTFVNTDAKVLLKNKYGNLNIATWDGNYVLIKVKITVEGDDLTAVEEKLSNINIAFNTDSDLVKAETILKESKSSWSWWKKNKNVNYQIDYNVKMPETNSLDVNNNYGNIYLDKLSGRASIYCDYGKIHIGELLNHKNIINIDYSPQSTIEYMKSGSINMDYSKLTIENSEEIRLNADYSTIVCNKTRDINFNTDYGTIDIDNAINILGNTDYTNMCFGTFQKNLKIDTNYGSIKIKNLTKGFESADISSEYSGVNIGVDSDTPFLFELDLQYAGFKRNNNYVSLYKEISKPTKKYYEGKYGKRKYGF